LRGPAAAGDRAGAGLAGGRIERRLDAGRVHRGAGFRFCDIRVGAEGLDPSPLNLPGRESGGFRTRARLGFVPTRQERKMHGTAGVSNIQIDPAILYFGTPVVLIGSTNEDGSFNLAPMSSAWWVGWRCMLGLARNSKTTENMIRTGECVLNLPSADLVDAVNCLARTTGSNPVPAGKIKRGYRHEKGKIG